MGLTSPVFGLGTGEFMGPLVIRAGDPTGSDLPAYVSIRQHMSAYGPLVIRAGDPTGSDLREREGEAEGEAEGEGESERRESYTQATHRQ